jgi:hypothetical protein
MKTLHLVIIGISIGVFILAIYLSFTLGIFDQILFGSDKTSFLNISHLANDTASKYGVFHHETEWYVHVTSDGKIRSANNLNHKIYEDSIFSCSFSIIPNDTKDHFVWLSVFRNNDTGYVVALDDQTGKVIDAKPVSYELAVCGP